MACIDRLLGEYCYIHACLCFLSFVEQWLKERNIICQDSKEKIIYVRGPF